MDNNPPIMAGMKMVMKYPVMDKATAFSFATPYIESRFINAPSLVPKPLMVMGIIPMREEMGYIRTK